MPTDEWARAHRILPASAGRPGPFDPDFTPYMRAFGRAFDDPRYKKVVLVCGSQMSKALALDTRLPTAHGWTTMGDVAVGDQLFDERGEICRVTHVRPVETGRPCYRVRFCDGSHIVADAEHLWAVEQLIKRRTGAVRERRLLTTQQMINRGVKMPSLASRFSVKLAEALTLPAIDLPVNPYLLGVWLGDGHSYSASLYINVLDRDILDFIGDDGDVFKKTVIAPKTDNMLVATTANLIVRLSALGIFRAKRIPDQYLRASERQRWRLLQGLMDTDGTVSDGTCHFCSRWEHLAAQVVELAASLGLRPRLNRRVAKDGYVSFVVSFYAYEGTPVFRSARKLSFLPSRSACGSRPYLNEQRYIRSIDAVESVPVRCIAVDSPSRLFLAGDRMTPTHNTETALNVMGSRLDQRPCPMIYVGPSKDFNNDQLEPRFMDLIEQSKSLKDKLARGKKSKKSRKVVSGVPVLFAWAGSSTPLKSTPAGLVLVDERDGMEASVQGEGDPVELVDARGDTYADFKLGVTSTPTEGNVETERDPVSGLERWRFADKEQIQSPIWRLWQEGTRHEWSWPCPHCDEFFIPRFKHLSYPEKVDPVIAGRGAHLICPTCGCEIWDDAKQAMNARGVYVAPGQSVLKDGTVVGECPESNTISFWVSGLCSPFQSFAKRVMRYVEAQATGDAERIKAVVNTGFGELFAVGGGEVADWREVAALRADYGRREVPLAAIILTTGIDVQGDRIYYSTRGWGARFESFGIEEGEIFGETDKDQIWADLELYLSRPIEGVDISLALIDTGYRPGKKVAVPTNMVYEFCDRVAVARACKGRDTLDKKFYASRIEVDLKGRPKKTGLTLWHLNTDYFKKWVHGRINWPVDQPGQWHLNRDSTDDYCKQIVSEARVVRPSGKPEWIKIRQANHFLDCEMLNAAAAQMLRVDLIKDGSMRGREMPIAPRDQSNPAPPQLQTATQAMVTETLQKRSLSSFAQRLNRR